MTPITMRDDVERMIRSAPSAGEHTLLREIDALRARLKELAAECTRRAQEHRRIGEEWDAVGLSCVGDEDDARREGIICALASGAAWTDAARLIRQDAP